MTKKSPPDARTALLAALKTMPAEAFTYLVLACGQSAMTHGGLAQIWPDGIGGFGHDSQTAIAAVRAAAAAYLETGR
jgi:4'-phosphopantetheinyl transferase EntD